MESRPTTASSNHISHTAITLELPSTIKPLSSALVVGEASQQYQPPPPSNSSYVPFPELLLLFSHKSCLTLCDPMNCSTQGFPVLHYLPEFAQTHVHWVSDDIQASYPLWSPSPPTLNLSQHQGLFVPGGQSIGASAPESVFPVNI